MYMKKQNLSKFSLVIAIGQARHVRGNVEASNVTNVPKCNKGPKCNKNLVLNVIEVVSVIRIGS